MFVTEKPTTTSVPGLLGTVAFVAPWVALYTATFFHARRDLLYLCLASAACGACACALAIIAARRSSRWWYLLVAVSFASEAILIADLVAGT